MDTQSATPQGSAGSVRLTYRASEVRMVVAGTGTLRVQDESGKVREIQVSGTPKSYAVIEPGKFSTGALDVEVSPGLAVYSFTFG